jgi:hypothetical protein
MNDLNEFLIVRLYGNRPGIEMDNHEFSTAPFTEIVPADKYTTLNF